MNLSEMSDWQKEVNRKYLRSWRKKKRETIKY